MSGEDQGASLGPHPFDAILTPERAQKYRAVLAQRTRRLVLVVEDCHDPHNATAVVRTADAFGLQEVHVTTSRNTFKINPKVSQGSHHYVDLKVWPRIEDCYADLRARGYRIFVSDLAAGAVVGPQGLAGELAAGPLALVFGSERDGVSPAASGAADGHFLIPMVGFPQSLNLSVSVAVTVYALRGAALSTGQAGDLSPAEQRVLFQQWVEGRKGEAVTRVLRETADRQGDPLEVYEAAPGTEKKTV